VTTNTTNQLNGDQARDVLYTQLYAPAFFSKLAQDFNIGPQTEEQAQSMLSIAGKLRAAYDHAMTKNAAASSNPFAVLEQQLDHQLGFDNSRDAELVKQASVELLNYPLLKEAALTYQNSYAQQVLDANQAVA